MRMWMVNPKMMCNKHLLGEHVELHLEWTSECVYVSVDSEGLSHPLAHQLFLEHHGLGRMHHRRDGEDRVVALDAVQEMADFGLHCLLEPTEALLELGCAGVRLARKLVLRR